MLPIKPIYPIDVLSSLDIYYFGWPQSEIDKYPQQYQSIYYGSTYDGLFELTDNEWVSYYAVFKNFAEYEVAIKSHDYLLFKDNNRVLINIGGKLYRFLINERKILEADNHYHPIKCNNETGEKSIYFHSISSAIHEIMIVVDNEGISALNWDGVLWKHKLDWAASGYLTLIAINGNDVITEYDNIVFGGNSGINNYLDLDSCGPYRLIFNIQTGFHKKEKL